MPLEKSLQPQWPPKLLMIMRAQAPKIRKRFWLDSACTHKRGAFLTATGVRGASECSEIPTLRARFKSIGGGALNGATGRRDETLSGESSEWLASLSLVLSDVLLPHFRHKRICHDLRDWTEEWKGPTIDPGSVGLA